jgi:hypothetical protein
VIVFVAEVGEQETGQRSSFCGAGTVPRRFLFCRLELQCMIMNAMFPFAAPLLKSSKGAPFVPQPIRMFFIALCGFYVCYVSFNQISLEYKGGVNGGQQSENVCRQPDVPYGELRYVHFPKPDSCNR